MSGVGGILGGRGLRQSVSSSPSPQSSWPLQRRLSGMHFCFLVHLNCPDRQMYVSGRKKETRKFRFVVVVVVFSTIMAAIKMVLTLKINFCF